MVPIVTELVGREGEVARLTEFLDGTLALPRIFLIEGDPGIGKSSLWSHGVLEAAERGFRVLSSRPAEWEARVSFGTLGDLLNDVLDEVAPALPDPQRRALRVALFLDEPQGPPPDTGAIGFALLRALKELASSRPILLAVDDLQWMDPPSFTVLSFALRRLGGERVAVLFAGRPDVGSASRGLERAVERGRLLVHRLGPLSYGAMVRLVRLHLGSTLTRATMRRIHEAAGGNPLAGLELARALAGRDHPLEPGQPLPVPETLQDLLRARLDALPTAVRDELLAAALLARPTLPGLRAASARPQRVAANLARAAASGIVVREDDRIRFSHPLLAEAIVTSADHSRRRAMHERIAAATEDPEERARHLALAADGPDASVAEALDRAAIRAAQRGAPDAAAELAEQAGRLTPASHVDAIHRRMFDAAAYYDRSGDTGAAGALAAELIRVLPPGPLRARTLSRMGALLRRSGDIAEALGMMEQALEEAGTDASLKALFHRSIAVVAEDLDPVKGVDHAAQAVALARRLGDPRALSESLLALATCLFLTGHGVQDDLAAEAFALVHDAGPASGVFLEPTTQHGEVLVWADRLDEARSLLTEALATAERRGEETVFAFLFTYLAVAECRAGHIDQAEATIASGIDAAERTEQKRMGGELAYWAAYIDALRGRTEQARRTVQKARAAAQASSHLFALIESLSVEGFIELSDGRAEAAAAALVEAVRLAAAHGYRDPGVFRSLPDAVEALVATGRLDEAEAALDELEASARSLDRPWALATGARCRGLLLAARGDTAAALAAFEASLAEHDRLPQPFERARTLLALGLVLRRVKKKRPAREALEEALATFERLGTTSWIDRARSELSRIGGRPSSPFELTPTERTMAELVAAGRSNREVAEALFLSINTVEDNLSRIYRKLQIRSRTQLAAKLRPVAD